jgi:PHD/YefM family antitoxin component YafN of YafNO toxin-antitoxin module
MLNLKRDLQAMTTFPRNPAKFLKERKRSKKPLVLTVNGKAEAVVQDAQAYQRLLDIAAYVEASEGIRQGTQAVKNGRIRPAREALNVFRRKRTRSGSSDRPRPARSGIHRRQRSRFLGLEIPPSAFRRKADDIPEHFIPSTNARRS